jgi:hypothetical protein
MAVIVNSLVSANSQGILGLCRPMDLVGIEIVAGRSSSVRAVRARRRSFKPKLAMRFRVNARAYCRALAA